VNDEIGRLTSKLTKAGGVERRRDAASQLRDLGFARRPSLEKRGTLAHPAESELATHELDAIHEALEDDDESVRHDAIIVVGDLGDASSVSALQKLCKDNDTETRLAAIDSLGDIGGTDSLTTLTDLVSDSHEEAEVRLAALSELEELAAKRITSGPDRRFDPIDPATTPSPDEPEEAMHAKLVLIEALRSIELESDADDLLRLKAADVRTYLESGIA
jgi:HEAT repeat protein